MSVKQRNPRAGGRTAELAQIQVNMHVNLGVARRELRNAAKRADLLMQAEVDDAAEAHLRIATAMAELDEIGAGS